MYFISHNGDEGKIWNIPFLLLFKATFAAAAKDHRKCCSCDKKPENLITQTTAWSNPMKPSHVLWSHPRWISHGEV